MAPPNNNTVSKTGQDHVHNLTPHQTPQPNPAQCTKQTPIPCIISRIIHRRSIVEVV
ncbi:hypothetical protein BDW74DRAFT_22045 [Aspergillus multicolor]|uniref:uncharacterized protein n=1 Tax=Aspergillus multicolor TaxID=41759 RepID=UPI003CCDEB6E